jgi:hypothetical protein
MGTYRDQSCRPLLSEHRPSLRFTAMSVADAEDEWQVQLETTGIRQGQFGFAWAGRSPRLRPTRRLRSEKAFPSRSGSYQLEATDGRP